MDPESEKADVVKCHIRDDHIIDVAGLFAGATVTKKQASTRRLKINKTMTSECKESTGAHKHSTRTSISLKTYRFMI